MPKKVREVGIAGYFGIDYYLTTSDIQILGITGFDSRSSI